MSLLDTASLIVTPNGYKEGKLYSVIPSDGSGDMSVTRATTATRVNSAGLVELVPYNLLTYSQDFTNADWIKDLNNGSFATNATAPDGTTTAQTLTAGSANFGYCYRFVTNSSGSVYAFSFYAKKGTANFAWMQTTSSSQSYVNLTTLAVSAASGVTITATNVGNGWVRIVGVSTAYSSSHLFAIGGSNASGSASMTSGTTIEVWGAQLVEGSTAKDYQKTETRLNIPRLDYSNGTCPSLLVEPQRTNVVLNSENFSNASWGTSQCSISANQTTSPDGTQNADKLIEDTSTGIHEVYSNIPFSLTAGVTYTKTIYAKSAERTQISFNFVTSGFGQGASVIANLSNGTLGTVNNVGGVTGSTATIINVGNGWYRISLTMTPASTATFYADFSPALNGAISYTGNGTSGIYIWGAQIELGNYATSYIPTTSASVTRNADLISKTGISSLIGQTEGTLFVDFVFNGYMESIEEMTLSVNSSNRIGMYTFDGTNTLRGYIVASGAVPFESNFIALTLGQRYKVAFAYKSADCVAYINGVNVFTNSSTFSFGATIDAFKFSTLDNTIPFYKPINATALWKTRLTNAQLATLTTL